MNATTHLAPLALLLLLLSNCVAQEPEASEAPAPIRVASFNIRYGAAKERDPRDNWPNRKQHVLATIEALDVDVFGVQEALHEQVTFLKEKLPRYRMVGQGRDGGERGEYAAVFYDPKRFELVEHGDFWLSETPDEVASVGWDAALTRMCTWVELRDKQSRTSFRVWNTHFDHRGKRAREHSARLIGQRVAASPLPDLVLGDLNSGEATEAVANLRKAGLHDTFRDRHPDEKKVGTFGSWVGRDDGEKIDYVLRDDHWQTLDASIDRRTFDGRNPSDHFPVTATVQLPQK